MPKSKKVFMCKECGSESPKWMGQCPVCGEWNSLTEEVISKDKSSRSPINKTNGKGGSKPKPISEISNEQNDRKNLQDNELNRVLGGGLVHGSVVLFGGDPGIGKSTLMLQVALLNKDLITVYVTGEESEQQIRMRAERLGMDNTSCYIFTETSTQNIFQHLEKMNPGLLVIDSVQTMHTDRVDSSPGSISQIRESAGEFLRYAKETSTPVFLIGHITKEGNIAGPKLLEHMVDTVLQFEGDQNHIYRLL
ncbi:MAG: ATPase domain-containing protein, partial [Flavobacteriales bacterium]